MPTVNIAAYGEGIMYPPQLATHLHSIQTAGWTSIMLGLFHVSADGDLSFNNSPIFTAGEYEGDPAWIPQLRQLATGNKGARGITLLASFGGWGVNDFSNIQAIYEANMQSFAGTLLEANCEAFASTFGGIISMIDMDVENTYDQPSFVAFCEMLVAQGFGITFCPYSNISFWINCLSDLNRSCPGAVQRFNLQCYAGGSGNDPQSWATAITAAIPSFNTKSFLLASDWARTNNGSGDSPAGVQALLSGFQGDPCVGGAFIWNLDIILNNRAGGYTMANYVQAIHNALGSPAKKQVLQLAH